MKYIRLFWLTINDEVFDKILLWTHMVVFAEAIYIAIVLTYIVLTFGRQALTYAEYRLGQLAMNKGYVYSLISLILSISLILLLNRREAVLQLSFGPNKPIVALTHAEGCTSVF